MPRKEDEGKNTIVFTGPAAAVAAAKRAIQDLTTKGVLVVPASHPRVASLCFLWQVSRRCSLPTWPAVKSRCGSHCATAIACQLVDSWHVLHQVEAKKHGVVIGPGGQNIKRIQTKTNTKIVMPDKKTDSDKVSSLVSILQFHPLIGPGFQIMIVGAKADIKVAKDAIKQLVEEGYARTPAHAYGLPNR